MQPSTSHSHSDTDASSDTAYDSTSPLLEANKRRQRPAPLPKLSLTAVCLARLVDPVNFSQIFPYVNEFMSRLHVTEDEGKIGFYSGLVESAFAFCQLISIYRWAKLSDSIGRRAVIMLGMAGLAVGTLGIGLSRSLWMVMLFRCLGGLFSGNVAAVHAAVGELSDPSNQNLIFPIYGLFWPLGSIVGPLIGGALANPAHKFAAFDTKFWRQYPYFLSCLTAAALVVFSIIFAFFCLEETLPKLRNAKLDQKRRSDAGKRMPSYGSTSTHLRKASSSSSFHDDNGTSDHPQEEKQYGVKDLLGMTVIRALCASGCALCLIATAFDVVFVLFCYSTVQSGGLGFDPGQIGTSLAVSGAVAVLLQVFAMPPLLKRMHAGKMYMMCMWVWPLVFLLLPFLNLIARNGGESLSAGRGKNSETEPNRPMEALLIVGIAITLALSRIGSLGYSLSLILVKQYAPNPQALASTNGLVQFAMCIARAIAPAFVSSVFALSIDNGLLAGNLWVVVMVVFCLVGCWVSRRIPRSRIQEEVAQVCQETGDATDVEEEEEDHELARGYEGDCEQERGRSPTPRNQGCF